MALSAWRTWNRLLQVGHFPSAGQHALQYGCRHSVQVARSAVHAGLPQTAHWKMWSGQTELLQWTHWVRHEGQTFSSPSPQRRNGASLYLRRHAGQSVPHLGQVRRPVSSQVKRCSLHETSPQTVQDSEQSGHVCRPQSGQGMILQDLQKTCRQWTQVSAQEGQTRCPRPQRWMAPVGSPHSEQGGCRTVPRVRS